MFNQIWREINDKHYLKALDYQAAVCKQNDAKLLRSKTILNHIETLYDEVRGFCKRSRSFFTSQRREKVEASTGEVLSGPHSETVYPSDDCKPVIYDVADLLIHHVKRQTSEFLTLFLRLKQSYTSLQTSPRMKSSASNASCDRHCPTCFCCRVKNSPMTKARMMRKRRHQAAVGEYSHASATTPSRPNRRVT